MPPANGDVSVNGNEVGDTAIYTCDTNYVLDGGSIATCTLAADGKSASFLPAPPTCTRKFARVAELHN